MSIPPAAAEHRLLTAAQHSRRSLVEDLARAAVPGEPIGAVCTRVSAAVHRHSAELLKAWIAAASPLSADDLSWLRDRYLESIVDLGRAACDAMTDSRDRHAVAQAVQCLILEHERDLRTLLASALASEA